MRTIQIKYNNKLGHLHVTFNFTHCLILVAWWTSSSVLSSVIALVVVADAFVFVALVTVVIFVVAFVDFNQIQHFW
jgi:hypothetical protein